MAKKKYSPKAIKVLASMPAQARKAPFWKRVIELVCSSARKKPGVNLSRIAKYAKAGSTIVVPDKVLGAGLLKEKITIAALSFSESAKKMVESAGGKAISIVEAAKKSPTGKDFVIIK